MLHVRLNFDSERYEVRDGDSPTILYSSPSEKDCNEFVRGEPEDPRDIIIRTLTAEVERLAGDLEYIGTDCNEAWRDVQQDARINAAAARALLARLEARP